MRRFSGKWFVPIIVAAVVAGCAPAASRTPIPPIDTLTAIPPTASATPPPPTVPQATPMPNAGEAQLRGADNAPMVYVPAGDFLMGSSEQDLKDAKSVCRSCRFDEETPQLKVYLDAFWIDQHEVTNAQYAQCVSAGKCREPSEKSSLRVSDYFGNKDFEMYPVVYVTWEDANKYCAWTGKHLPTEAEWEKAARGTDGRIYPWGNQWDAAKANTAEASPPVGDNAKVGQYPAGASPYGALDMAGNVWEWVSDWYDPNYYSQLQQSQPSPPKNPQGPASGTQRIAHGGDAFARLTHLRIAFRGNLDPSTNDHSLGFRCAQ